MRPLRLAAQCQKRVLDETGLAVAFMPVRRDQGGRIAAAIQRPIWELTEPTARCAW